MRSSPRSCRRTAAAMALAAFPLLLAAQTPSIPPDPRFKADILLIVAHPDDESAVSSFLAQAIFDQSKRVAVVYGTRGDGGGNTAGPEQAASLGAVREIEARQALATLGVDNVWFLDGRDTPSQDVLQSLETWHHGSALEQAVRLVRLTRPEVMITWLPQFVIGENHGDHQAAGVIATEAFDLAGDPAAFPSQVAPSRNRTSIGNLTEGLTPWQPKKLYYFSDRTDVTAFRNHGPSYPSTALSPSKKVPYYQFTAELLAYHRTQGEEARIADKAVKSGDYRAFLDAQQDFSGTTDTQLILGRNLAGGTEAGDVFEAVTQGPIRFRPPAARPDTRATGLTLELGGPWTFYRAFRRAHDLEALGNLFPVELGVNPGSEIRLPLIARNGDAAATNLTVSAAIPSGWSLLAAPAALPIGAGDSVDFQLLLKAPPKTGPPQDLTIELRAGDRTAAMARVKVRVTGTLPF